MTATKTMTGQQVWDWLGAIGREREPGVSCTHVVGYVTVAEVETACGVGSVAKARRWSARRTSPSHGLGVARLYAYHLAPLTGPGMVDLDGKRHWPMAQHVRPIGQEQPTDLVAIQYPCVA